MEEIPLAIGEVIKSQVVKTVANGLSFLSL